MNILHIAGGGDIGGAKTHVISLLSTLKNEHNVTLVSLRSGAFSEDAIKTGIPTVIIPSNNYYRIITTLKKIIAEKKVEVVHCHGTKANLAGWILQTIYHIPVVTTVHSDYRYDYMGSFFKRFTLGLINSLAIRNLHYRIAVSDMFTDLLIERGMDPIRTYTINNSLEFSEKDPFRYRASTEARRSYLQKYGLSYTDKTVIIGIAVRFHPVKDVSTLIHAFGEAVKTNPDLRLLIGGCGVTENEKVEEERLHALVNDLSLHPYIGFTGWVNNTNDFFDITDISVLSSLSEGFPYSVLESISRGAMIICSRVGILSRIIDHGTNGFLFNPGDSSALCKYILTASADKDLRNSFAAAQYDKSRRKYSLQSMANHQIEIYKSILCREKKSLNKQKGITVCGAYGFNNAGDEAILHSILQDIKLIDPYIPVTVISKDPKQTRKSTHCRSVFTFSPFGVFHSLITSRLYINGGGTLMQDQTSTKSLMYYLLTIVLAKICRTPVILYGSGIGPISKKRNQKIAGIVLNHCTDIITLRDEISLKALNKLGVTKPYIRLTGDPAMSFPTENLSQSSSVLLENGIDPQKKYVCVSLRSWNGFTDSLMNEIAHYLDLLSEKTNLQIVFISMCYPSDIVMNREVQTRMKSECIFIDQKLSVSHTHTIIGQASLVLSMRLHGLIFAVAQEIPAVGVCYDIKVESFLEYAQKPYFVALDHFNFADLLMETEKAIQDTSTEGLSLIRARERQNINFAKALLTNPLPIDKNILNQII